MFKMLLKTIEKSGKLWTGKITQRNSVHALHTGSLRFYTPRYMVLQHCLEWPESSTLGITPGHHGLCSSTKRNKWEIQSPFYWGREFGSDLKCSGLITPGSALRDNCWLGVRDQVWCWRLNPGLLLYYCSDPVSLLSKSNCSIILHVIIFRFLIQ